MCNVSYKVDCSYAIRLGRAMIEYYAKIVFMEKGAFKYCVTIWKSYDGIESIYKVKKFVRINKARMWAEKILSESIALNSNTIFIKESDILRRKWHD